MKVLRKNDLRGAYEAMSSIESEDPWIHYNRAVLAAALPRYDTALEHVKEARSIEDHRRFEALVGYIEEWRSADAELAGLGLDVGPID